MFWRTNTFYGNVRLVAKCDLPKLTPIMSFETRFVNRVCSEDLERLTSIYDPSKIYYGDPASNGQNYMEMITVTI